MHIGVIGAGVAGLQLGIRLRQHGVDVTIYADRSSDEIRKGRLLNAVVHHHRTLEFERRLGIDAWDAVGKGWRRRTQHIGGPDPVSYSASLPEFNLAIDYRVYLPTLMRIFEDAGGTVVYRPVHVEEADRLAEKYDLLVVATRRGSMPLLFPIRNDLPLPSVKRRVFAALVDGIARPREDGIAVSVAPSVGELIETPMITASGHATALMFEWQMSSTADAQLSAVSPKDQESISANVLDLLRDHFPQTAERVDSDHFTVCSPRDVFTASIASSMRCGSAYLPSGRLVVALGDVHVLLDPLTGQGANMAAFSSSALADAILTDLDFDEQFARRLAADREPTLQAALQWTDQILVNPSHVDLIHQAAAVDRRLADDFARRHADPLLMWQATATHTRSLAYLGQFTKDDRGES